MSSNTESIKVKQQILSQLGKQELKVLELIGKNTQGVTVKEISRLLQCVNSTANNLLMQLCDLNFLVRDREGRYVDKTLKTQLFQKPVKKRQS